MTDDESNGLHWMTGNRAAWVSMLNHCLKRLGIDDPEAARLRWVSEREETIAKLREICESYGDQDWEETLHLPDIIEKHIDWDRED